MGFSLEVGMVVRKSMGPGPSLSSCCGHAFGSPAPTAIPPMHVHVRATVRQNRDQRPKEKERHGRENANPGRISERRKTVTKDDNKREAGERKRGSPTRRRGGYGNVTAVLFTFLTFLSLHVSVFRVRLRLAIIQD